MGSAAAIDAIEERARVSHHRAVERWIACAPDRGPIDEWVHRFRDAARLTVNFHPDRIARGGGTVASGLAQDGYYRTQWNTGVSAGSRSAVVGGERQRFEREFFDGAYETIDTALGQHPVYGAFDLLLDPHGGAPRFGSCFLVLRAHVRERTTLCLGDSHLAPPDVGTFREPSSVIAGLMEQAADGALLNRPLGRDAMLEALTGRYRSSGPWRDLDGYVEAQIHGGVSLADDVDMIVLDPSFCGSPVERHIARAAKRNGFEVEWHPGSEIHVDDVPVDFRGSTMPALAARVAGPRGTVDACAIGVAAAGERFEEPSPTGDDHDSLAQQLKYLWHTVLAHGRDMRR